MQLERDATGEGEIDVLDAALERLEQTQADHGAWEGDYGGPLFLLPLYVATTEIVERPRDPEVRDGIVRYLRHHQNDDGGWGLHVEAPSYVYTSVLNYVALRLLGVPADDPDLERARSWFRPRGGAARVPQWGAFTLALLGLIPWRGVMPVPPELWLLPRSLPVHPGRMWCHARMVYLPMSYLYGRRATADSTPLLEDVAAEIAPEPVDEIDWRAASTEVAEVDRNLPLSPVYRAVNEVLVAYEERPVGVLRTKALEYVLDQVDREDHNTEYICIGPINKLLNTLCWHFARPDGPQIERHLEQLPNYLWQDDDGVRMQGYNNSQLWDTTFAVQSICATGRQREYREVLEGAHDYIESNQVLEEVPDREACYRSRSTGGWPFSNREHGWPITDCTAEGVKASLLLEEWVDEPIERRRLEHAIDHILSMQNPDGGWPTYEQKRGPDWLEVLNPTQIFEDIMVDYSCVECTSACLQALDAFRDRYPKSVDGDRLGAAVADGRSYLLDEQRADGSWYGSWGVCFTYGTWFGIQGLLAAGLPPEHRAIQAACDFLVDKQLPDGGWGETPESCRRREYVHAEEGQAVMTAWALLALVGGGRADTPAARRGVRFLEERQREDGTWPDEHIAGVFNRTCAIHYDNYLKIFPPWAIAVCS